METNIEYRNFLQLSIQAKPEIEIRTLKRFEFSAARALEDGRLSGNNFIGWAGVRGPVDPQTGMQINIADLKRILTTALDDFDHRNLTRQLAPLHATTANITRALFTAVQPRLNSPVSLDTVELHEEDENGVIAGQDYIIEIVREGFSAAHRTHAPRLSAEQNQATFGICNAVNGHGHNYHIEAGLEDATRFPRWLVAELDHRNLSLDTPELAGRNVVTEALARLIAEHTPGAHWVRVWETPDFYAEYLPLHNLYRLGRQYRFHAAHRLASPALSSAENQQLYGKCNRPDPHGHTYLVQVSVESPLDPHTETAFDLGALDQAAGAVLQPLEHTYLDEEIPFFTQQPSTGENIATYLFEQLQENLGDALHQVKLWETPNNQFTARRKQ